LLGKSGNLGQFWQELKRRKVIRVITLYASIIKELIKHAAVILFTATKYNMWMLAIIYGNHIPFVEYG
jgi:hypothetical protein